MEVKKTMAEVVAQRRQEMSPGRRFAEACANKGFHAAVEYDVTITDSLTSSRRKPRYPARNMLKVVDLSRDPREFYWHESPPAASDPLVRGGALRREAGNRFHKSPIPALHPTTAWVRVPDGLWEDAETFESFINYRLIVRLATAENHSIISGAHGLLNMPGIETLSSRGSYASTILTACNEVEQMGGTADGLIINPVDFYTFMGKGSLMDKLEQNGMFIVRTRLVEPGSAIVGDFGHGALLFDAGRSVIKFAEPPPGTLAEPLSGVLAEPGIGLMAEIYERVVINLPTNFFFVDL